MKPIIIYGMPRSQSTVILQSCKRKTKHNEPFDRWKLFGLDVVSSPLIASYFNNIDKQYWDAMFDSFNEPNTAVKFFGTSLRFCMPARRWYTQVIKNNSHDIFVCVRDLKEVCLSYIISYNFGYIFEDEIEPKPITIGNEYFSSLLLSVDSFLRFFPEGATLVTYDTLPEEYFDKSQHDMKKQNSLNKAKYITNYDFCVEQINHIIKYYQEEYDEKMATLKQV